MGKQTNWNLSEKGFDVSGGAPCGDYTGYFKDDVKEFIKRLKDEIKTTAHWDIPTCGDINRFIDKLAGASLSKELV